MNPNINEILGLLIKSDPQVLSALESRYPGYEHVFKQGVTLGSEKSEKVDQNEIFIRAQVCLSGLTAVLKICEVNLPALKLKLKRLGNIQFVSQVIIAISGAALLSKNEAGLPQIKIISGSFVLIGSLLTLYVQHKSGTVLGNSKSIFGYYDKLVDNKFEAESLKQEISIELQVFDKIKSFVKMSKIINDGNMICLEIRKILDSI